MRITDHPVLTFEKRRPVTFFYEGKPLQGHEGEPISSALHANGIKTLSYSVERNRPRGFYCAIGNCASCNMVVDGVANVRTCITPLKENMDVRMQKGKGRL